MNSSILFFLIIILIILIIINSVKSQMLQQLNYTKLNHFNTEFFWKILDENNISRIHCIPSGDMISIIAKAPKKINWVNVGNELFDSFLASVYGYYTNGVGVILIQSGPGFATAISAMQNAIDENLPLLVITIFDPDSNSFQYWNLIKTSIGISNTYHITGTLEFKEKLTNAIDNSKYKSTCSIVIINKNVLEQNSFVNNNFVPKRIKDKMDLTDIISQINKNFNNKNTILVIGQGKFRDYNVLVDFIKRNKIPYVTTYKQRMVIDGTLYCGRVGSLGTHSANYALYNATNVLLVGENNISLSTYFLNLRFTIDKNIRKKQSVYALVINKNLNIEKNISIDKIYQVNEFEPVLAQLNFNVNPMWINQLVLSNKKLLVDLPRKSMLEKYIYAANQVYNNHKDLDISIGCGVGNFWYGIAKYFNVSKSNHFEIHSIWASIGVGITNGLGLFFATNKPVWIFEGDGSIVFSLTTLFYLIGLNEKQDYLPITLTIYNDNLYSAITTQYESNKYLSSINNPTNNIPWTNWNSVLPENITKYFTNPDDYYNYLNNNPSTDKLRIIVLQINGFEQSNIYEIAIDEKYQTDLENSNFSDILNARMILHNRIY